jgi:hypothetical protein
MESVFQFPTNATNGMPLEPVFHAMLGIKLLMADAKY